LDRVICPVVVSNWADTTTAPLPDFTVTKSMGAAAENEIVVPRPPSTLGPATGDSHETLGLSTVRTLSGSPWLASASPETLSPASTTTAMTSRRAAFGLPRRECFAIRLYLLLCAANCWIPRHLQDKRNNPARRLGHAEGGGRRVLTGQLEAATRDASAWSDAASGHSRSEERRGDLRRYTPFLAFRPASRRLGEGPHRGRGLPSATPARRNAVEQPVRLEAGPVRLDGDLAVPADAGGVVLFAHGSGSGRHSPRNRQVAARLGRAGLATLLLDLLTPEEETADRRGGRLRFDVELLAGRLLAAIGWLGGEQATAGLPVGLFGASTGAGAALLAAAERPEAVAAVVSRGGRPDLAGAALDRVRAPTLLIVGALDPQVLALNRAALDRLGGQASLEVIPGASHLFEEPGALDQVAELAAGWFARWLAP
jgi:putative phosphoribosyl transferase